MKRINLYLNTIKYLKLSQIMYRLYYWCFGVNISSICVPILRKKSNHRVNFRFKVPSFTPPDTFHFLGKTASLLETSWVNDFNIGADIVTKLWRYHLHYFDDLQSIDACTKLSEHDALISNWIAQNPIHTRIAWEPYPTSLRIVNWIKWDIANNQLKLYQQESLYLQSRFLIKRLEWDILGNHLFANAKALIFAGAYFDTVEAKQWLTHGQKILDHELEEQILEDGGHFELSPMYHSIILEDIIDILNLNLIFSNLIDQFLIDKLWIKAVEMLDWLVAMSHPDGDFSYFNDSVKGIAATTNEILEYARIAGPLPKFYLDRDNYHHLGPSGYIRVRRKNFIALIDVARVGPDYQPGHGHADTLSFEVSVFKQRFLVNTGVSTYEKGEKRIYERGTSAHNSVKINNVDSSEVWSAFRVADRATPQPAFINHGCELLTISCAHNGYRKLYGTPQHSRKWIFSRRSLVVLDEINGKYKSAKAYYHFHPDVEVFQVEKERYIFKLKSGNKGSINAFGANSFLSESYFSESFGVKRSSQTLELEFLSPKLKLQLDW